MWPRSFRLAIRRRNSPFASPGPRIRIDGNRLGMIDPYARVSGHGSLTFESVARQGLWSTSAHRLCCALGIVHKLLRGDLGDVDRLPGGILGRHDGLVGGNLDLADG